MTAQDKAETEDDALASENFRRDLRLYGRVKDTLRGFSQGIYPEYNMVIDWADACGDIAHKTQQSAHDIAWAAFQKCTKSIELEKVGLPIDKFNSILDEAVQNEIESFINKHSDNTDDIELEDLCLFGTLAFKIEEGMHESLFREWEEIGAKRRKMIRDQIKIMDAGKLPIVGAVEGTKESRKTRPSIFEQNTSLKGGAA
ncbi:hypothetical protein [Acetobacter senegalensis]|uniref:hypothetical protein n=1 Tax=Acetobacter senegalensis TaxID=446692 RepID=UPI002651EEBA|nr:hypothetical protein [Acetobacter senegalensis]MDN7355537.1 hypothetical protein [Acetobacter senegalensis]